MAKAVAVDVDTEHMTTQQRSLEDAYAIIDEPTSNDVRVLRLARALALAARAHHDACDHARFGEHDDWHGCTQTVCQQATGALVDAGLDPRHVTDRRTDPARPWKAP